MLFVVFYSTRLFTAIVYMCQERHEHWTLQYILHKNGAILLLL